MEQVMNLSKLLIRAVLSMVFAFVLVVAAHAQSRASIQGVVTDPQGAVVSGATVKLKNLETNQTVTAVTNDNGIYNFNSLPPSRYSISVEKAGFKQKVLDNVGVIAEQANALNIQLEVGQVTESVTVNAGDQPLIDTETGTISGTLNRNELENLPSIGRDPFQLLRLAPGVFGDGATGSGGGSVKLPGQNQVGSNPTTSIFMTENQPGVVANGVRNNANSYQIDGVQVNSLTWTPSI